MKAIPNRAPYDPLTQSAHDFLFQTASYLNDEERETLENACVLAFHAHDGQTRKSGEPYITHPLTVAAELAKWHMDIQALCAGVMHDVLEDTEVSKEEIAEKFGETIAEMVDGLSKLEKLEYGSQAEHQAESFRKLILAMTKDIRVIIVKLADRLHNMRTLGSMRLEKRRRIAQETLEIHAPIANRIGLNFVYRELQDLAFANLYPNRYRVLKNAMAAFKKHRHNVIEKVLKNFNIALVSANIEAQIRGREKNLYSIFQKMRALKIKFSEVLDIYGFRVVVNNIPACYAALGALHGLYQPKPGKIKDFIAIPKSNGYQSLHTTLIGPYGLPIEVQIRTRAMNAVAEGGVASHWSHHYDEASSTHSADQWLKNILDLQAKSADALEFLEDIKVDLFHNEIYIFTPKGKIITLPRGATAIDFAYAVHTDIGNHASGVKINNHIMPLRTALRTGDNVEIITSEYAKPHPGWLNLVVSSRARSAIRNYFKNIDKQDAIAVGERLLRTALTGLLPSNVLLSEELKNRYLDDLNDKKINFEDILYRIGRGDTQAVTVAMEIANLAGKYLDDEIHLSPIHASDVSKTHLCRHCKPLPGDDVSALVVQGEGLAIHRDNCPILLKSKEDERLSVDWVEGNQQNYDATVEVCAYDGRTLLAAMAQAIASANGDITAVDTVSKAKAGNEGFIEFAFNLNVSSLDHLNAIIRNLLQVPQVRRVTRL